MKFASALRFCLAAFAVTEAHLPSGFSVLSALHHKGGHHHKSRASHDDPLGIMGSIMSAAQQSMSQAQSRHEQVIKVARQNLTAFLTKESSALAQGIRRFNDEMTAATAKLASASQVSQKVLDKATKESASWSWDSPLVSEQSQLNVQKDMADRVLSQVDARRKLGVSEAVENAVNLLADMSTSDRRLGDVSDLVKDAQQKLNMDDVSKAAPTVSYVQQATDMKSAGEALAAAKATVSKQEQRAKDNLAAMFAKVEKDLKSDVKAVTDGINSAEKVELKQMREGINTAGQVEIKQMRGR